MTVKFVFPAKPYCQFGDAGKCIPSNKAQSPASEVVCQKVGSHISHPAPFIDRLTLVMPVPEQYQEQTYKAFWECADNSHLMIDAGYKAKSTGFNAAKRLVIDSVFNAAKYPLFQMDYGNKRAYRIRLEFVPVDLKPVGILELKSVLDLLVDGGWDFIAAHGHISRIDVTVDIPGMTIEDIWFLPGKCLTTTAWSKDGCIQTFYMGTPNGNQTKIYRRDIKRIDKGQAWDAGPETRVERRLTQQNIKVADLLSMKSPFKALKLFVRPSTPPPGEALHMWELFCDSVRVRNLPAAFALLPEKKRTLYRKHFEDFVHPKWNETEIWKQWPDVVANSGLLPKPLSSFYKV